MKHSSPESNEVGVLMASASFADTPVYPFIVYTTLKTLFDKKFYTRATSNKYLSHVYKTKRQKDWMTCKLSCLFTLFPSHNDFSFGKSSTMNLWSQHGVLEANDDDDDDDNTKFMIPLVYTESLFVNWNPVAKGGDETSEEDQRNQKAI